MRSKSWLQVLVGGVLVSSGVAGAQVAAPAAEVAEAVKAPATWKPPAFRLLRQDENWSALKDADPNTVPWLDRLHRLASNEQGDVWLGIGGSLRYRFESWRDFDFGAVGSAKADDSYSLTRALLHADMHLGSRVRVFLEGRTSQVANRDLPGGTRPVDADSLDLNQGFLELGFDAADGGKLRIGRQSFAFGKQRLVSPLPWPNNWRGWDGASAEVKSGPWSWTALWSYLVDVDPGEFNEADSDNLFWGLYARRGPWAPLDGAEFYALGIDREAGLAGTSFNGTAGDTWRATFGSRLWGRLDEGAADWELEGAYQTGEVGQENLCAWMLASQLGYTLQDRVGKPRLFVGLDYASGDRNSGGTVKTFDPLFPLAHAFHGYIDTIARQNLVDANVGVSWDPVERLTLATTLHGFWRAETGDAVYKASGAPIAGTAGLDDREIGQELDLLATYRWNRHTELSLGWSRFFAGDSIEAATPGQDTEFVYLGLMLQF